MVRKIKTIEIEEICSAILLIYKQYSDCIDAFISFLERETYRRDVWFEFCSKILPQHYTPATITTYKKRCYKIFNYNIKKIKDKLMSMDANQLHKDLDVLSERNVESNTDRTELQLSDSEIVLYPKIKNNVTELTNINVDVISKRNVESDTDLHLPESENFLYPNIENNVTELTSINGDIISEKNVESDCDIHLSESENDVTIDDKKK